MTRTFGTQTEAKFWLSQTETALVNGTAVERRGGDIMFAAWVDEWLRTRQTVKPATRAADTSRLKAVLAEFGDRGLRQITPTLVRQWVATLSGRAAPNTVRHYHVLLHSIFELAVVERLIPSNPCVGTPLPELVAREPVFLSETELADLIDAHPPTWRPVPLTLAGTGLRWAELAGLRCRYVNLARRELTVAWTYSGRHGWQTPKTKASRRTVTLPAKVGEVLRPQIAVKDGDEHVLTMPSGGPLNHGYRSGMWRRAVRDAGLEAKAPVPHDLRHTHASMLILAGVPLTVVQRRLGHTSIKITSDIYGHVSERSERLAADAMDVALGLDVPDVVPDNL